LYGSSQIKETNMTDRDPISLSKATWRGFLGKCPNCGEGHLFGRFLKVADHCEVCGEEFFHHRADDFPAYLVIVIVGHLVVPIVLAVEVAYAPPYWLHFVIWTPLIIAMSLGLLQPVKGAVVGVQWQVGMHGFEISKLRRMKLATATAQTSGSAAEHRAAFRGVGGRWPSAA
jgi:uncharacterized protein (DUF983 family)